MSEACAADGDDLVTCGGRQGLVVRRKGGWVDLVGLADQVAEHLAALVDAQGPGPLLRGQRGGRLSRQVAWRWIRRCAVDAGIAEKVYPHLLRHSFVIQSLLAGVALPVVQAAAGRRDLRSTLGYAQALAALAALGADASAAVARCISQQR